MADPAANLREDRALRKAARALLDADIAAIKGGLAQHSIPARIGTRLGKGARELAGGAGDLAQEHRNALAAGLAVCAAGLLAFLFRGQVGQLAKRLGERCSSAEHGSTAPGTDTDNIANE